MTSKILKSITLSRDNYCSIIKLIARYRGDSVRYTISYIDSHSICRRQNYYSFDNANGAYKDCVALYSNH